MTKLKIKVTKEILEKAKDCQNTKQDPLGYNCAIALAIREVFPFALVYRTRIGVFESEEHVMERFRGGEFSRPKAIGCMALPIKAQQFIMAFDMKSPQSRATMDEIEFEMEIPDDILETINITEVKEILKTSKTLELKEV